MFAFALRPRPWEKAIRDSKERGAGCAYVDAKDVRAADIKRWQARRFRFYYSGISDFYVLSWKHERRGG